MAKYTKKSITQVKTEVIEGYTGFDHYIGIDWSSTTMAIARINSKQPNHVRMHEQKADLRDLQHYLRDISGKRIVLIEESTPVQ